MLLPSPFFATVALALPALLAQRGRRRAPEVLVRPGRGATPWRRSPGSRRTVPGTAARHRPRARRRRALMATRPTFVDGRDRLAPARARGLAGGGALVVRRRSRASDVVRRPSARPSISRGGWPAGGSPARLDRLVGESGRGAESARGRTRPGRGAARGGAGRWRPGVPRHGGRLREAARAVRAADRLVPGDPAQVRRDARRRSKVRARPRTTVAGPRATTPTSCRSSRASQRPPRRRRSSAPRPRTCTSTAASASPGSTTRTSTSSARRPAPSCSATRPTTERASRTGSGCERASSHVRGDRGRARGTRRDGHAEPARAAERLGLADASRARPRVRDSGRRRRRSRDRADRRGARVLRWREPGAERRTFDGTRGRDPRFDERYPGPRSIRAAPDTGDRGGQRPRGRCRDDARRGD